MMSEFWHGVLFAKPSPVNALACRRKKWPFHLTQIAIIKIVGIQNVIVILVNALKKNLADILNKIVVWML